MVSLGQLQEICNHSIELKYRSPFVVGEYTYATNGNVIVRVKGHLNKNTDAPVDLKKLNWAIFDHPPEGITISKQSVYTVNAPVRTCPECKGKGEVHFKNTFHNYECECMSCDGEGRIRPALVWKMADNCYLFFKNLELGVKNVGDITYFFEKPKILLPFCFEGGQGFFALTTYKDTDVVLISGQENLFNRGNLFEVSQKTDGPTTNG